MKLWLFLFFYSLVAVADPHEVCEQYYAQTLQDQKAHKKHFAYALGTSAAIHAGVFAYASHEGGADGAKEGPKQEKKEIEKDSVLLKSEEELIAEAKENIQSWKEKKKLSSSLTEFLIQAEIEREPEKMQKMRYEELQKFRAMIVESAKKIDESDIQKFKERLNEEVFLKYASMYCEEFARFTDYVENGCGNCSARTKFIISALMDGGIKLPKGFELATQLYSNHIQPVLFNPQSKEVHVLVGEELQHEPAADLYAPSHIHCGYLRDKHADKEDCLKTTLLYAAKAVPKEKKETDDSKTNDSMDFGKSAAEYPSARAKRSFSYSKGGAGLQVYCAKGERYYESNFDVSFKARDLERLEFFSSKEDSVSVFDPKICDELKQLPANNRFGTLLTYLNDELNELLSDSLVQNIERSLEKIKREPAKLIVLQKLERKLDTIYNLLKASEKIRKDLGIPQMGNPKVKYIDGLRKDLLKSIEKNDYQWMQYLSTLRIESEFWKVVNPIYALGFGQMDMRDFSEALSKIFLDHKIVNLAPKKDLTQHKEEKKEILSQIKDKESYNTEGKKILLYIKLQPTPQEAQKKSTVFNDNIEPQPRPIVLTKEVFAVMLERLKGYGEKVYPRFNRELLQFILEDKSFWLLKLGSHQLSFFLTPEYINFINRASNFKELGFSKKAYIEIRDAKESVGKNEFIPRGKFGPLPLEAAQLYKAFVERSLAHYPEEWKLSVSIIEVP